MIDAKDLRVGNLVTDEFYEHFKTVIKVSSINEAGINLEVADDGNIWELANHYIEPEYTFEKIYPIELTPETLEKAGFVREERGKGTDFDGIEIVFNRNGIDLYDDEGRENRFAYATYTRYPGRGFKAGVFVNYVHQLQNLYYSLTTEELHIQL